jgi:hypothetical protein
MPPRRLSIPVFLSASTGSLGVSGGTPMCQGRPNRAFAANKLKERI